MGAAEDAPTRIHGPETPTIGKDRQCPFTKICVWTAGPRASNWFSGWMRTSRALRARALDFGSSCPLPLRHPGRRGKDGFPPRRIPRAAVPAPGLRGAFRDRAAANRRDHWVVGKALRGAPASGSLRGCLPAESFFVRAGPGSDPLPRSSFPASPVDASGSALPLLLRSFP